MDRSRGPVVQARTPLARDLASAELERAYRADGWRNLARQYDQGGFVSPGHYCKGNYFVNLTLFEDESGEGRIRANFHSNERRSWERRWSRWRSRFLASPGRSWTDPT